MVGESLSRPMKNLLIYLNPAKKFVGELETNLKIQIDNSFDLGWKKDDILLVTNFPYEYQGVKSLVVGDENYRERGHGTDGKIFSIVTLFNLGVIEDDLYWYHDLDAYQSESDIDPHLDGKDYGMVVDKTYIPPVDQFAGLRRWCGGSIFFQKAAKDIFDAIKERMLTRYVNEELGLIWAELTRRDHPELLSDRLKDLNMTYNFCLFPRRDRHTGLEYDRFQNRYDITDKPIKIIHFRYDVPYYYQPGDTIDNLKVCFYGQLSAGVPLISTRLIKIFNNYGIK